MIRNKSERNISAATILRGVVFYTGLTTACFYGIKGEWGAALIGVLAAAIVFLLKDKKKKETH